MYFFNKKKGIILLEHRINEAVNENYSGLHQFNLCIKENNFHIWNKNIDINMTEHLENKYNVNIKILDIDYNVENYHLVLIEKK